MANVSEWFIGPVGGLQFDPTTYRVEEAPDDEAPVITVTGGSPQSVFQDSLFTPPEAVAIDNVDGQVAVSISGVVDTSTVGAYNLVYEATDAAGNIAQEVVVINVLLPPDEFLPQNIILGPEDE